MKSRELSVQFGNLICKFGEKGLLSYAKEIVFPVFTDESLRRVYDKTEYFFHDIKFEKFSFDDDQDFFVVCGRIIKDTLLEREQVYTDGDLVRDSSQIQSSPSSFFVLILNYHRLLYVEETKNAPTMATFKSTLTSFLKEKYKEYINELYLDKNNREKKRCTKKYLMEMIPKPSLEIVALTSDENINEFIDRYDLLSSLSVVITDRNHEIDNDAFFEEIERRKKELGSDKSDITHRNSKGLNKEAVKNQVKEATSQGNQYVSMRGKDVEGDKLIGNNEQFQIRTKLASLPKRVKAAAMKLLRIFRAHIDDESIKVPTESEETMNKLGELFDD